MILTLTLNSPVRGAVAVLEVDAADFPAALTAAEMLVSDPERWLLEGRPLADWLRDARRMFAPADTQTCVTCGATVPEGYDEPDCMRCAR
jgi:hypothetical protein